MSSKRTALMEAVEAGVLSAQARAGRQPDYNRVFMGLLFSLFVVALPISIVVGVHVYNVLAADRAKAEDDRLALSLLVNDVRAADAVDSVAVGRGPEGRSLVLVERLESGTYETRIYQYQQRIVQEYSLAGAPYTPSTATTVVPSRRFEFEFSRGLITIRTDQGISSVALRSGLEGGVS